MGSRDENTNRWCSRVWCLYSLKLAHLLKERTGAEIFNFYIDMRTPGKGFEEFYQRLLSEGVHFIRGKAAEVTDWALELSEEGKLVIRVEDTLSGFVRRIPVEMVVLSVGLEPQADAQEVRRRFNIACSTDGFFLERHPKLAPVNTFTDGIFLAGCCQGPKDIPDTVAQAGAAAAEALALIDAASVELEPNTAYIVEEGCSGCKSCIRLCPYRAISFEKEKKKAWINEALCKGCGVCVAACPSGDCHYVEGNDKALRRFLLLRHMLKEMGIEEDRFRLEWISASEGERVRQVMNEMVEKVKALGPLGLPAHPKASQRGRADPAFGDIALERGRPGARHRPLRRMPPKGDETRRPRDCRAQASPPDPA